MSLWVRDSTMTVNDKTRKYRFQGTNTAAYFDEPSMTKIVLCVWHQVVQAEKKVDSHLETRLWCFILSFISSWLSRKSLCVLIIILVIHTWMYEYWLDIRPCTASLSRANLTILVFGGLNSSSIVNSNNSLRRGTNKTLIRQAEVRLG